MIYEQPRAILYTGDSRRMPEIEDGDVDLAVTSPPYWHIKDYGCPGQIGFGQSLHQYLGSLFQVWEECFRVIREGGRLCVNVGDQFARATVYGRYRVIPLHAEIIRQCELLGFDFLGSIIWQKKTTMNTSGGAVIMGSFPFPPNGIVELDYEHILLFKKPGASKKIPRETKESSRLTRDEWKLYFCGHWSFGGAGKRKAGHEAPFPEELPRRLIRMFSFAGDTVLDPFLGSGTTARVALELGRNAIGYEISEEYAASAKESIRGGKADLRTGTPVAVNLSPPPTYVPEITDALPEPETPDRPLAPELFTVESVMDDCSIRLNTGQVVRFLGVSIRRLTETRAYLEQKIEKKRVFLKDSIINADGSTNAYVYLKNRIFVNTYLIKSGVAEPDGREHRLQARFEAMAAESRAR